MRMRVGLAAVAAVALIGAGSALAQTAPGVYVGAMGGGNYVEDRDIEFQSGGLLGDLDMDMSSEWGWAAGGTVGFRHGDGVRTEFEGMYRTNKADELSVLGFDVPDEGRPHHATAPC